MQINNIQNFNTSFNGLIRFKNGKVINPDYIISYVSNTERGILYSNDVMNMDIFMKKDSGKGFFRYYNEKTKQLDWLETDYNEKYLKYGPYWNWHKGWIDKINVSKLKMINGDRYDFTYKKIVVPPHLSEITRSIELRKEIFPKMPEPKKLSTFEEIIEKAKSTDEVTYIDADLV